MLLSNKKQFKQGDIVVPLDDLDQIGDIGVYLRKTPEGKHLVVDAVIVSENKKTFQYNIAEYDQVRCLSENIASLVVRAEE